MLKRKNPLEPKLTTHIKSSTEFRRQWNAFCLEAWIYKHNLRSKGSDLTSISNTPSTSWVLSSFCFLSFDMKVASLSLQVSDTCNFLTWNKSNLSTMILWSSTLCFWPRGKCDGQISLALLPQPGGWEKSTRSDISAKLLTDQPRCIECIWKIW